ncbi:MAG: hypothetical protein HUK40_01115 [Desulfobacter sp.]|nr:hypothetical protein [Desulfobacter sp.]WDP85579.1 MAG: hypothetical protein HUN05_10930 [Desulfobacter sp.]
MDSLIWGFVLATDINASSRLIPSIACPEITDNPITTTEINAILKTFDRRLIIPSFYLKELN